MKRKLWFAAVVLVLAAAFAAIAQLVSGSRALGSYFPDGALLYIEAKDFHALLKDWNSSEEKKAWIKGSDYEAFSRSRLFDRLGGAQSEFAAAATIATDTPFLSSVAGSQSALALYDIGNLEFVYVTRMSEAQAQTTALWQAREKFEARSEGGAQFYVRQDQQSNRTAAFAVRDGWLILGTRADLVAGVLDRLQIATARSLQDEPWYVDSVKQTSASGQDLRMALNLERIVPSPYFRSYWVQRNITEMKQYRAAICDLRRGSQQYTEDRVLLRKTAGGGNSQGGVEPLLALAPSDAVFASAQASPGVDRVITELRENALELKTTQQEAVWSAPASASRENAGNAGLLEERIDVAPVLVKQTDPYQPLRALLNDMQPSAMLETYTTRSESDAMFVGVDRAIVLEAPSSWNQEAVGAALAVAIRPGLTVSQLGLGWVSHTGEAGNYAMLEGLVSLAMAVRDHRLFLTTSAPLMQALLKREGEGVPQAASGVTYAAIFHHSPKEQEAFKKVALRLDAVGHISATSRADANDSPGDASGQAPSFFTGNVVSLSRMFADVASERVEERDEGSEVKQRVVYEWRHASAVRP